MKPTIQLEKKTDIYGVVSFLLFVDNICVKVFNHLQRDEAVKAYETAYDNTKKGLPSTEVVMSNITASDELAIGTEQSYEDMYNETKRSLQSR